MAYLPDSAAIMKPWKIHEKAVKNQWKPREKAMKSPQNQVCRDGLCDFCSRDNSRCMWLLLMVLRYRNCESVHGIFWMPLVILVLYSNGLVKLVLWTDWDLLFTVYIQWLTLRSIEWPWCRWIIPRMWFCPNVNMMNMSVLVFLELYNITSWSESYQARLTCCGEGELGSEHGGLFFAAQHVPSAQ